MFFSQLRTRRATSFLLSIATIMVWAPVASAATSATKRPAIDASVYEKLAYHHLNAQDPDTEEQNVSPVTKQLNAHNRHEILYSLFSAHDKKTKVTTDKNPILNSFSWDDLELFMGEQDHEKTLLSRINRTHTTMGAIQLQKWLTEPSDSIEEITNRQKMLQLLIDNPALLNSLNAALQRIGGEKENSLLSFFSPNDSRQLALRRVVEPDVDENMQRLLEADKNFLEKIAAPVLKLFTKKPELTKGKKFSTNSLMLHLKAAGTNIWNFKGGLLLTTLIIGPGYVKSKELMAHYAEFSKESIKKIDTLITDNGNKDYTDTLKALLPHNIDVKDITLANIKSVFESDASDLRCLEKMIDFSKVLEWNANDRLDSAESRKKLYEHMHRNSKDKDDKYCDYKAIEYLFKKKTAILNESWDRLLAKKDSPASYHPLTVDPARGLFIAENTLSAIKMIKDTHPNGYTSYTSDRNNSALKEILESNMRAIKYLTQDIMTPLATAQSIAMYPFKKGRWFAKNLNNKNAILSAISIDVVLLSWLGLTYMGMKDFREHRTQTYLVQDLVRDVALLLDDAEMIFRTCEKEEAIAQALPTLKKTLTSIDPQKSTTKELREMRELLSSYGVRSTNYFRYFTSPLGKIYASYNQIRNEKQHLAATLKLIGSIDAIVSMAKYYKEHQATKNPLCFVTLEKADRPHLKLDGFWNVMIDVNKAVPSDIELGGSLVAKNGIISGPNAGGKSASMKGITLAILFAQAFGIAPARQMTLTPFSSINTYLNIKDDIAQGRSKFKMEAYRAHDLVNRVTNMPNGKFVFSMMDETFSSTDPKEGSAALYSILRYLSEKLPNSMNITASHFPLIKLLEKHTNGTIKNYKIVAEVNPISYPFELFTGPSDQVIAIDLLEEEGLDIEKELQYARDIIHHPELYV